MGITVHFEGRLRDEFAYEEVVRIAEEFAAAREWGTERFTNQSVHLQRVRNEEDWDYVGPTKGITLAPHTSSEPLVLEFDKDLYIQEYVKTQFAPIEVHKDVVLLIETISMHFEEIEVIDEGEYYETKDEGLLEEHRERCNQVLDEQLANNPNLKGPVRLPNGRIVDIISDS